MAAKKVDIMELRQLLLLKQKGESNRCCEKLLGTHRNTINDYVRLFIASGVDYKGLLAYDDKALTELFPSRELLNTDRYSILSGYFSYFERELKKPGCTREVLWREYLVKHPDGYGKSQFNEHFARWRDKVKASGKLTHKVGDKMYVDYTGKKLHIIDKQTGELTEVGVFVGILPASQYTYFEATRSQKKRFYLFDEPLFGIFWRCSQSHSDRQPEISSKQIEQIRGCFKQNPEGPGITLQDKHKPHKSLFTTGQSPCRRSCQIGLSAHFLSAKQNDIFQH